MPEPRLTAWLRLLLNLLAFAGVVSLAACGGGNGAPNNQFAPPPPVPPALQVQPATTNAYSGVPTSVTITSGVAPFSAFTSNASVLPVSQAISGNTLVLIANPVDADRSVLITIQDAIGQTVPLTVSVHPAPLLNSFSFAPSGATCGANLCSGQNGTATIIAKGPAGAPLVGRQIKFEVVSGPIAFLSNNPATPQVQTISVITDVQGVATVAVQAQPNAPTQPAVIRATDVTSGQVQNANFTVVNSTTSTQSPITVVPSTVNITSAFNNACSSGFRVDYYIYGGTPPYTISNTFPTSVTLVNNIVQRSGDFFEIITNGTCVNPLVFAVTDSAGKQPAAQPQLTNVPGASPPVTAPRIAVTPGTVSSNACLGNNFTFAITGGTPPYNAFSSSAGSTVTPNLIETSGGVFVVTPNLPSGTFVATIVDSSQPQQTITATVNCAAGPAPPSVPLAIAPNSVSSDSCSTQTFTFIVTGGTGPYTLSSSPVGANITQGGNQNTFLVRGLPTTPGSININVLDASNPPTTTNATISCNGTALAVTAGYNYSTSSCVNQSSSFSITGGQAPYAVFFAPPVPTGAAIVPTTVGAPATQGGPPSFTVTGLRDTTSLPAGQAVTTITVQDSGAAQQTINRTITCP